MEKGKSSPVFFSFFSCWSVLIVMWLCLLLCFFVFTVYGTYLYVRDNSAQLRRGPSKTNSLRIDCALSDRRKKETTFSTPDRVQSTDRYTLQSPRPPPPGAKRPLAAWTVYRLCPTIYPSRRPPKKGDSRTVGQTTVRRPRKPETLLVRRGGGALFLRLRIERGLALGSLHLLVSLHVSLSKR